MDPLSFTACIITMVGLVAASSKKIYDLRDKLNNAPKDVEDLLEQLRTFESLLTELNTQLQDHQNSAPPQETLQQLWGSSVAQMERDVQSLQTILSKVEPLLEKKLKSSKMLLLARQILSEKEVEQYQRKIDTHCGTLTSIQAMVCGWVTYHSCEEYSESDILRLESRKLDKLSQSIIQLGDEDRTGFRTVSSQLSQSTSQLGAEFKDGLSRVSSQLTGTESANDVRHQTVLAHLDGHAKYDELNTEKMDEVLQQQGRSIDMNEAGFQAIQSSLIAASSSNSKDHNTTHAMLSQCQGHLQQILRNHITFGTVEHSVHLPSTRPKALDSATSETTVFWNHRFHRLPIGSLQIRLIQTRQTRDSRRSTPQVRTKSKIAVEFAPPRWLSRVAIRYSMKLNCDLIGSQWRWGATLEPLTVNYNSCFINAVKNLDVEGVRTSFAEGLAKPTHYMLDGFGQPMPWYWVRLESALNNDMLNSSSMPACEPTLIMLIINYLWCSNFWGKTVFRASKWFQAHIKSTFKCLTLFREFFFSRLLQKTALDERNLLRNHVNSYLKHGGRFLTAQSGVFEHVFIRSSLGRIDWFPDFLFNSSEPWLIDDFSSLQIRLIGILAHVDAVFHNRLKRELASYRTTASLGRTPFVDNLFETSFGTASIESHFRTLSQDQPYHFLSLLCRAGAIVMMKIFIAVGFDVNGGSWRTNLLGNAAATENIEVVCMLLEAGANGSLALKIFLDESEHLSDALFRRLLGMLVGTAGPASFESIQDLLCNILKSRRALHLHPKAPEIPLNRKGFGGGTINQAPWREYWYNYMFLAISGKRSFMVDLLLQNGAHANAQISHFIDCNGCWFESCTWITFSVMYGAASCTDVLIQHGADVTALDGADRSAIQLARINASASHPRRPSFGSWWTVTAEEDAETLVAAERAFGLKLQGTTNLEHYIQLSNEPTLQLPPRQDEPVSILRKTLERALATVLTPFQTAILHDRLRVLYLDIRKTWSLPFYEALLMRFIYVLSYILVLAWLIYAFIKGHKRIPMPSRSLLSAAAVLMLALVWGSSQMFVSWGAITAGSNCETDFWKLGYTWERLIAPERGPWTLRGNSEGVADRAGGDAGSGASGNSTPASQEKRGKRRHCSIRN